MITRIFFALTLALLTGCATGGRNPTDGRQNEFDGRISMARDMAEGAKSPARDDFDTRHLRCLALMRDYVGVLNAARHGGLTITELRAFEYELDQEIGWLEAAAQALRPVSVSPASRHLLIRSRPPPGISPDTALGRSSHG